MKLEARLSLIIQQGNLNLDQKIKIVEVLVLLTYFCKKSARELAQEQTIDFFMNEIRKVNLADEKEVVYLYKIVSWLQNITS